MQAQQNFLSFVNVQLALSTPVGLARAPHAFQDSYARSHRRVRSYEGLSLLGLGHVVGDFNPSTDARMTATFASQNLIKRSRENFGTGCSS